MSASIREEPVSHELPRRTIVQGAAWAVPIISVAAATPQAAASIPPGQPVRQINTVRLVDNAGFVGTDGNVYVWGFGGSGQYGNGTYTNSNTNTMRQVNFCRTATDLTGTVYGYYAIANSGRVYYWGEQNYNSPISTGTSNARPRAVQFNGTALTGIADVTSTEQAAAALTSAGVLYKMGRSTAYGGRDGQFGAEVVSLPATWAGASVTSVVGGYRNFYVQGSNGRWGYWGGTDSGAVPGNPGATTAVQELTLLAPWFAGRTPAETNPLQNPDGANIVSIEGGIGYGLAVLSNGKVLTWGLNTTAIAGRTTDALGVNSGSYWLRPGYAKTSSGGPDLTGIVSARAAFTGAALLDGNGALWGYGKSDSISYERFNQIPTIIKAPTPNGRVTKYGVGQGLVMAETTDGNLWGQGYNGGSGNLLGGSSSTMKNLSTLPVYASAPIADPNGCVGA